MGNVVNQPLVQVANHGHTSTLAYSSAVGCQGRYLRGLVRRWHYYGATRYRHSRGTHALYTMFLAEGARGNSPDVGTGRLVSACEGDTHTEWRSEHRLGSKEKISANERKKKTREETGLT